MANSTRMGRINDDIQLALSSLLRQVKDPRVQQGLISVTRVETTGDLRYAKVWLSVLGQVDERELKRGLKSCAHISRLIEELDTGREEEHGPDGE